MPRFELRDAFGNYFQCHTSEPRVAAGWLLEHAQMAVNGNASLGPWYLTVWPLFPDGKTPDWPVGGAVSQRDLGIRQKQFEKLAELLEQLLKE